MAKARIDHYNIEDLALETGAQVTYADGRKFNSAGLQAQRKRPEPTPPPAPVAAPTPEPPKSDDRMADMMKQILSLLNRPVEVKLPEMPTPNVVVKAPDVMPMPPTEWVFEFERNPNGTIKRINASSSKGVN